MMISHKIDEMHTIYSYLSMNSLTVLDSAQAMFLLVALPKEWGSFAMTLPMTLPLNINTSGIAAGIPQLTFSNIISKIQEEWSHHSGRFIMLKDNKQVVKKEQHAQVKESTPCCWKCKGHHAPLITGMIITIPSFDKLLLMHTLVTCSRIRPLKRKGARKKRVDWGRMRPPLCKTSLKVVLSFGVKRLCSYIWWHLATDSNTFSG